MSNQVQVSLDEAVYNRLLELQVPPLNDINSVIDRLLFHSMNASLICSGSLQSVSSGFCGVGSLFISAKNIVQPMYSSSVIFSVNSPTVMCNSRARA